MTREMPLSASDMDQTEQEGLSSRCQHAARATFDEYPLTSTIGVFAVGLTLGVLAGAALAHPFRPDSRRTAESLGRRILDAMRDYVPQSVNQYLPG